MVFGDIFSIINLLGTAIIIPLAKMILNIRNNHLAHIQQSLDRIEGVVSKTAERLNEHITWHAEKDTK